MTVNALETFFLTSCFCNRKNSHLGNGHHWEIKKMRAIRTWAGVPNGEIFNHVIRHKSNLNLLTAIENCQSKDLSGIMFPGLFLQLLFQFLIPVNGKPLFASCPDLFDHNLNSQFCTTSHFFFGFCNSGEAICNLGVELKKIPSLHAGACVNTERLL